MQIGAHMSRYVLIFCPVCIIKNSIIKKTRGRGNKCTCKGAKNYENRPDNRLTDRQTCRYTGRQTENAGRVHWPGERRMYMYACFSSVPFFARISWWHENFDKPLRSLAFLHCSYPGSANPKVQEGGRFTLMISVMKQTLCTRPTYYWPQINGANNSLFSAPGCGVSTCDGSIFN